MAARRAALALFVCSIAVSAQNGVLHVKTEANKTASGFLAFSEQTAGEDFESGELEFDKLTMMATVDTGWYRFVRKRDASNDSEDYYGGASNLSDGEREEQIREIEEFVFPKAWMWVLICFHSAVFVVGIVGNTLVCVAVYKNQSMRTVTNYFIVNLAVADFLVILFCLPPSVLWDVTSTWFFGVVMCKVIVYLQVSRSHSAKGGCETLGGWGSR